MVASAVMNEMRKPSWTGYYKNKKQNLSYITHTFMIPPFMILRSEKEIKVEDDIQG